MTDRLINETRKSNPDNVKFAEAALVRDFLASRSIWTEGFWKDYMIFLKNGHVLLGIFFTHPLHPFSRCGRMWLLIAQIFFSFFAAAMSTLANIDTDCVTRGGDLQVCTDGALGTGMSIIFGILSFVYIKILTFFAVCGFAQNTICERCCNFIGSYFLCYGVVIGAGLFAAGMAVIVGLDSQLEGYGIMGQFFTGFATVQAMSWAYGILIGLALYWWSQRGEWKDIEKSDFDDAYSYWKDKNYKIGWGSETYSKYAAKGKAKANAAKGKAKATQAQATEMASSAKGKVTNFFSRKKKEEV